MPPPGAPPGRVPAPGRTRPRRPASLLPAPVSSPAASRNRPGPPSPPRSSRGRGRGGSSPRTKTWTRCTASWSLRDGHPAVDRPDAPAPRQHQQWVDVEFLDLGEICREARDPEERLHDGLLVRWLGPPEGGQEGVRADLPHHLLRVPPRQGRHAERDVLHHLHVDPPHPEHEERAELRVPAHPQYDLPPP